MSRTPGEAHTPPPRLGEQARQILAAAGYSNAEIEHLIAAGVVAEPTV